MQIPIVFCADARYGQYIPVVVQSILDNAAPDKRYAIIVFDCGILDNDIDILKQQISQYKNFSFEVKTVVDVFKDIGGRIKNQHLMESPAMLAPLFIPQLCAGYDKVIYADMDMVFNRDIAELMEIDLGENYIAAVVDAPNEAKRLLREGSETAERDFYINSGLVVFNIKAWRDNNLMEQASEYLVAGKNGRFFDQAAINFVCKGHIKRLDTKWNNLINCRLWFPRYNEKKGLRYSVFFDTIKKEWQRAYNSQDTVYHWTGWAKPWVSLQIPFADIWWYYAAKTDKYRQFFAAADKIRLFQESDHLKKFCGIPVMRIKSFLNTKKYYLFGMKRGHIAEWRVDTKTGHKAFCLFGIKVSDCFHKS